MIAASDPAVAAAADHVVEGGGGADGLPACRCDGNSFLAAGKCVPIWFSAVALVLVAALVAVVAAKVGVLGGGSAWQTEEERALWVCVAAVRRRLRIAKTDG